MPTRHRITLALAFAAALGLGACGNHVELKTAQASVYDIDFAIVYTESMSAVQKLYPNFSEDATKGVIQTSWHQVSYANTAGDDASTNGAYMGNPMGNGTPMGNPVAGSTALQRTNSTQSLTQKYFVRFDVTIVGGRPWRVHVKGHAAEWVPGNAIPSEMHGANVPHWLQGRTDELTLAIYERLKAYAQPGKPEDELRKDDDLAPPIDTSLFGKIPADAVKAASAVESAVERRDYDALRANVADDVTWSLGADPSADVALATWQADPSTLDALVSAMKAGCGGDDKKVVCPAAAAADSYRGWRATFEPRGKTWKLTAFLKLE
jgi:hypothetical protein